MTKELAVQLGSTASHDLLQSISDIIFPSNYGGAIGGYAYMVKQIEILLEANGFTPSTMAQTLCDKS